MDNGSQKELQSLATKLRVFDSQESYLKRYQTIVVGNQGLISLLKYELIITTFGWIPGALGVFLRKHLYSHLFKPKLKNVIFGKNVDIFNPDKIRIGKNCLIGDNCLLEAKTDGSISIGDDVSIGRGCLIRCGLGSIEIGNNTRIAAYSHISAIGATVKLGRNVLVASYCCIIGDSSPDVSLVDVPMICQSTTDSKGIVIGEDIWLGAGVSVLDGVNIRTGSVIGAGSVVTKDIPEYSIAVGVPARVIKSRI